VLSRRSGECAFESVLKGKERRAHAGRDADLVVDVLNVVPYCLRRHKKDLRDLLVGQAADRQTEHIDLAVAKSCRVGSPLRLLGLSSGSEHGKNDVTVEAAFPR
jgi:hypothetical protein